MTRTERAVSIALTHAFTISITTILISGLLIGAGNLLENQERRAATNEFEEIGGDVVSHVNTLDRMNETGQDVNVSIQPAYPEQVANQPWQMEFADGDKSPFDTAYALNLSSSHYPYTVQYPINTSNTQLDVGESPANQDSPTITLCSDGTITFGECP